MEEIKINGLRVGQGSPLLVMAGPCVLEDEALTLEIAETLAEITSELGFGFVFKASFDKANRSSVSSYRGPGMKKGLEMLALVKEKLKVPVISDIHVPAQAEEAAKVLDVIQIPAFLCRQTDLLVAAGRTGKPVNVKKGQFMSPYEMKNVIDKIASTGNRQILLTERGSFFGYNSLVVDFRSLPAMRSLGFPVVFDATHSVQSPGGGGSCSSGDRTMAPVLARAAVAVGVDAVFFEVHPDPDKALCDGPNSLPLGQFRGVLEELAAIRRAVGGNLP